MKNESVLYDAMAGGGIASEGDTSWLAARAADALATEKNGGVITTEHVDALLEARRTGKDSLESSTGAEPWSTTDATPTPTYEINEPLTARIRPAVERAVRSWLEKGGEKGQQQIQKMDGEANATAQTVAAVFAKCDRIAKARERVRVALKPFNSRFADAGLPTRVVLRPDNSGGVSTIELVG